MHDVVHIDRSKLHTLESLSSAKFRKSLLKKFASQKHAASDVANMSDLDSDDDDESDGAVLVPKKVMRAKTNKSINRLFGKCDRSESDDDDDDADDDDAVAAAAAAGCVQQSAKIRRVDSSSLSSLNSMDSTKTKVSRSKHMRAVLGYSDDDSDDDKEEPSTSSFRPLQRRSSGKRKAPCLQTSSTKRKKNSGRDNIVVDIMYNSNSGGQGVGTARLGRAPRVSCSAVVDA